jgi:hypothetical protein
MQTDAWIGRAILMCTLQGCECIQKDIGTVSANLQPFFWGNVDPKMAIGQWGGGTFDTSKMIIRNIVLFLSTTLNYKKKKQTSNIQIKQNVCLLC